MNTTGITDRAVADTPVAVIDFETTGLTPGGDRVVEVSIVRVEPGEEPRLVLDTLVNPMRRMAATEIHGISDDDVVDAPRFFDIAGELVAALNDCVVAAYNVYFDLKFLNFELQNASVYHEPPHFCLMYMRPMLGLGSRCKLEQACRLHGIEYDNAHVAASDALASAKLLGHYLEEAASRDVHTYGDLANLKRYKFVDSFANDPFPAPAAFSLPSCDRLRSRVGQQQMRVHQVTGLVCE
jgi:DNA polymerase III epsilon subunit-like protein